MRLSDEQEAVGYGVAACRLCPLIYADHSGDGCRFEPIKGDEWCDEHGDWLVNCYHGDDDTDCPDCDFTPCVCDDFAGDDADDYGG